MHAGCEDLVASFVLRLGRVHGEVSVAKQVLGGLGAGFVHRHTDAGRHEDLRRVDTERLGE